MYILYLFAGLAIGFIFAWTIKHLLINKNFSSKKEFNDLKNALDLISYEKNFLEKENIRLSTELKQKNNIEEELNSKIRDFISNVSRLETNLNSEIKKQNEANLKLSQTETKAENIQLENLKLQKNNSELSANLRSSELKVKEFEETFEKLNETNKSLQSELSKSKENFTIVSEQNKNLIEKLNSQKQEIESIGQKFTNEFKVLADTILDQNSKKFTEQNRINIGSLLEPLNKNIEEFKKKVEDTYVTESKERHSLGEKVKELAELNQKINQEAKNLTQALKGSVKQQGNWGEMLLERILENSGLSKGREYTVQEFLRDDSGNTITDDEGKKLQPDVIVQLPNDRKIIIDSKVSLVAYEKYVSSDESDIQKSALIEHIISLKSHIDGLSNKNYQDFEKSLDFVMLFVPIEPAYMLAMQNDSSIWEYAYKKRVLLISPTNLIAALKLVSDLWQREQQSRNAMEIAKRGSLLLEKFHGFLETLDTVGKSINKSQENYNNAMNQLKTGPGNLIGQVEKLKKLGVKTQKTIPSQFLDYEENEVIDN